MFSSQLSSSPTASVLASVASRAALTVCPSTSSLISVFQTTLDNKVRVISLTVAASSGLDTSDVGSDTDSGCCVVSLEDGEDNNEVGGE